MSCLFNVLNRFLLMNEVSIFFSNTLQQKLILIHSLKNKRLAAAQQIINLRAMMAKIFLSQMEKLNGINFKTSYKMSAW